MSRRVCRIWLALWALAPATSARGFGLHAALALAGICVICDWSKLVVISGSGRNGCRRSRSFVGLVLFTALAVRFVWPMAFPRWPIDIVVGQFHVLVEIRPVAAGDRR